jgi:hypothetical protein
VRRGPATVILLCVLALPASAEAQGAKPSKRCDFLDPSVCLYPWPNDLFTKRDRSTATGRRLNLARASMPRNRRGKPVDPTDINRADGFSPGAALITKVPGLDTQAAARRSKLPPIGDLSKSLARRSPVVVINARSGRRHPVWAEIDSNPSRRRDRVLIIRPGRNFEEGGRYIVALRDLRDGRGRAIRARLGFRLFRDRIRTDNHLVEERRAGFERIFKGLRRAGVSRRSLYLAWGFTVASRRSLTGRALHIRDEAFGALGDTNLSDLTVQGSSPQFTVDSVTEISPADDPRIARRIEGTITAPCYLTNGCAPGGRFVLDSRGLPTRQGDVAFRYFCQIPRSALDPAAPRARPALAGHGLLGDPADDIDDDDVEALSSEHNFVFCATAWAGFASEDLGYLAGSVISDISNFAALADRMQQGFLQQLYLGRALIHPQGLGSHAAFQKAGASVLDTTRLFYDGNSQGGIQGGALTALAPDFERAVLGVPGMNYSTLLQRSVDFDAYAQVLYPNYPKQIERQLWLSQMQLLWDRGEANGYAHHMTTRPLPNTPAHAVLLHVAFADHQVPDFTAAIMARTAGVPVRQPALAAGRSPFSRPWFGLESLVLPSTGSGAVWWDAGTPPAPLTNVPNRAGEDPHGAPRAEVAARVQKSEFLKVGGSIVEVCGGGPCFARGYTGP